VTPEQVKENTGFELDVSRAFESENSKETDIKILREKVDPEGIFLKKTKNENQA
jgi:glutaconate CoA-transferase subunit B